MRLLARVGAHAGGVDALVVSPRGELVSAGRDGHVIGWGGERARLLHRSPHIAAHRPPALPPERTIVRMVATDAALVGGTTSGELVWVDWDTAAVRRESAVLDERCSGLAAFPGDLFVAAAGVECVARVGGDGSPRGRANTDKYPYSVSASADGRRAIVGCWDGQLLETSIGDDGAWNDRWLDPVAIPKVGYPIYTALDLGGDRLVIGTEGRDGPSLALVERGRAPRLLASAAPNAALALALSPDQSRLAVGDFDGVHVFDVATLAPLARLDLETLERPKPEGSTGNLQSWLRAVGIDVRGLDDVDAPRRCQDVGVPGGCDYSGGRPSTVLAVCWRGDDRLFAGTMGGDVLEISP